jgi:glycosyltransferase involved in cell wall biosynthesis
MGSGISVVIPVHNGGDMFRQCLDSIFSGSRQPDEVLVVADGDTDGSWRIAEEYGARVLLLPEAGGPARARNRGAQIAKGEVLFFVDADVTLHLDTLAKVEQQFSSFPDLAALIGSYDDAPGAGNFLSQYKNLVHHYTHQTSAEQASTFWGACGAMRSAVFEAMGGFDERYRKPCIEDIELGYRLRQAGYTIRLCKDIQVKHLKRWEPWSLLRAEVFYRAIPWTSLILRSKRFDADLNLNHASRFSVVLAFGLAASIGGAALRPEMLWLTIGCALGLLIINRSVYQFFYAKRGLRFTLQVIPWHWFYFLYGGGAFAVAWIRHHLLPSRIQPEPWGHQSLIQKNQ